MKDKIIYYIVFFCLSFTSCSDLIDVVPENSATFENGMDSEQEFDSAINAMNYYLRNFYFGSIHYPEVRGYLTDRISNATWIEDMNLADNTGHVSDDFDLYKVIAEGNLLYQSLQSLGLSEDRNNYYKGSIAFYKAFAYKMIAKTWGDAVIINNNPNFGEIAKSPMCEVIDYAIELAKEAVEFLPEYPQCNNGGGTNDLEKSVASKGAARALLAELCLWQVGTKWFAPIDKKQNINEIELLSVAEKMCSDIIESNVYIIDPNIEQLCDRTLVDGGVACVFKLFYKDIIGSEKGKHSFSATNNITWPVRDDVTPYEILNSRVGLSSDFAKSLFSVEDDRRKSFFYNIDTPTAEMLAVPGLEEFAIPYKFRNPLVEEKEGPRYGDYLGLDQDGIVYRLAHIYLMRSEARAKLGKTELAVEDINYIRARASADPVDLSDYENDPLLACFYEQEREFLYEKDRYFRIIRFGENYIRRFLKGKFKTLSEQDAREGALFEMYGAVQSVDPFDNNYLFTENIYWSKRK